jgi:kynureninase
MTPLSRKDCIAQDAKDPLSELRSQFDLPDGVIYLDGNSLGALPRTTAGRLETSVKREWGQGLIRSWNDAQWMTLPERVGEKIAKLIGALPQEVIAADSTSVNLFKVLTAALRIQREEAPQRRVIVSERDNFPTDLYVAQGLLDLVNGVSSASYTLELIDSTAQLEDAIAAKPALVLLTHVNYRSGALYDMNRITRLAHEAGVLVVWDLAHSAGALPVALNEAHADFAVGCGYKYLNGGPGAPAYVYVAERHQDRFWQPLSGWIGHAEPFLFESAYRPRAGVGRYLCGTPSVLSLVALDCGLDTLLAAEPLGGMSALRTKSLALAELFVARVSTRLAQSGLHLFGPKDAAARGSQVSYVAPLELQGGYAIMQALIARGVIGDFRAPNLLRFGMTPLYTRYVDVWDAVEHLAEILETRAWDRPEFHRRSAVT